MKKTDRTILVVLADTQGGNKLGLMSPNVVLEMKLLDGDKVTYAPELTAAQKYLWHLYKSHISEVDKIAGNDRICVLHLGDLTTGMKYMSFSGFNPSFGSYCYCS
jgi:hypothetical protein